MIWAPDVFAGERFAVVGLGRNGLPVARALQAMGAEVFAWDDSAAARDAATGLRVTEPEVETIDAVVLSPGIPHALPAPHPIAAAAIAAGVPILSDAELLFRAAKRNGSRAKFIGVTGTNGKSTTTALAAHILAEAGVDVAAGGNLGTPALALPSQAAVYVLEMSSYMLERLATIRFDGAAMLNLSPDHLDRHGTMVGYIAAKRQIFARQTEADTAVIGVDDAPSRAMAAWLRQRPARVETVSGRATRHRCCEGRITGQNAAAAAALCRALGLDDAVIARGIATFRGLAHRQEFIGTIDGVAFVNDSKATNADSAARALQSFPRVAWIAGGIAKAGGIEPLVPLFGHVAHAVLIGRDAPLLAATLADHGVSHEIAGTIERAVPIAARVGQTVLLSPACASFDQFSGFEARGDAFRAAVAALR